MCVKNRKWKSVEGTRGLDKRTFQATCVDKKKQVSFIMVQRYFPLKSQRNAILIQAKAGTSTLQAAVPSLILGWVILFSTCVISALETANRYAEKSGIMSSLFGTWGLTILRKEQSGKKHPKNARRKRKSHRGRNSSNKGLLTAIKYFMQHLLQTI